MQATVELLENFTWPWSNYKTTLNPLCCHCHVARTRTSGGGPSAVCSASCPKSPSIQMERAHTMKDGLWRGYYYLGGGVQPLTGGCHQGGKRVAGSVGRAMIHCAMSGKTPWPWGIETSSSLDCVPRKKKKKKKKRKGKTWNPTSRMECV